MGAYDFQNIVTGSDPQQAFDEVVSDKRFEKGHGGYTGSIGEKDSFTIVATEPMSLDDAEQLANRLMNEDDPRISDKWGPAGAIPVFAGGVRDATVSKEFTTKLTDANGLPIEQWQLANLVTPKVKPLTGHVVQSVEVPREYAVSDPKFKIAVETVKGEPKIDYRVSGGGPVNPFGQVAPSYADFATLALARAEVTRRVTECPVPCEVTVTPIPRHTTVRGVKKMVSATVTATVVYRKIAAIPAGAKPDAWLFFGFASS